MRNSNNINSIDLDAEAAEGNIFWVVYDMDTQETLMSTADYGSFKWKPLTLNSGDNWGLSELDDTARFRTLEEAHQVAEEAADALAAEYPGDEINLEIHRVRLEMVEMIQDIDCEAGKVKRAGSSDEEEDEGEVDLVEDDEEEDYYAPSRSISSSRGGDVHFTPISGWGAEEDKKPKKAKKSTKNGKKGRA